MTSHHDTRRRDARALDAMCAPPGPPAARMSETERRDLANELAAAGFDLDYLARRYDLPRPDTTTADMSAPVMSGHQPGHDRSGQRQLSAPDHATNGHGNGRSFGQNSHRSVALERTR